MRRGAAEGDDVARSAPAPTPIRPDAAVAADGHRQPSRVRPCTRTVRGRTARSRRRRRPRRPPRARRSRRRPDRRDGAPTARRGSRSRRRRRSTVQATKAGASVPLRVCVPTAPTASAATPPGVPSPPAAGHDRARRGLLLARRRQRLLRRRAPRELQRHRLGRPVRACAVGAPRSAQARREVLDSPGTRRSASSATCGGKWYFRIGDRAEWSYLLPRKLPKGALHHRRDGGGQGVQRVAHRREDPGPMRRALVIARRRRRRARRGARGGRAHVRGDGRRQVRGARRPAEGQAEARTVKVGGKRCAAGARTALSALAATKLPLTSRTTAPARGGRASRARSTSARSRGERARAAAAGSTRSAAASARRAPRTRPARSATAAGCARAEGAWFWCVKDAADACQRTLEVAAPRDVGAGRARSRVTVRGYDENGGGVPVAGVEVAPGAPWSRRRGAATVTAPGRAGTLTLRGRARRAWSRRSRAR